jgi:predicted TIM-barrel fold metal-dependent hydrolase
MTTHAEATIAKSSDPVVKRIVPISADSHVMEPPNCYIDYIDPKYRERAPRLAPMENGADGFYIEGFLKPISIGTTACAGVDPRKITVGAKFEDLARGSWDPKARLADQDRDGVAAEFIYPSVGMVLCSHPDLDYKSACLWAYNRWLEEFVGGAPGRLYGVGQITITSVDQAIKDLQKLKDMGFKGVMMPGEPDMDEDYDDPSFDPLWAAAAEMELPLSWHILTGGLTRSFVKGPQTAREARESGNRYSIGNQSFQVLRMCQDIMGMLVWSRVFERHPALKVVCVEADAGWAPH